MMFDTEMMGFMVMKQYFPDRLSNQVWATVIADGILGKVDALFHAKTDRKQFDFAGHQL